MLEELVVDGLGAIDHAEIELGQGLSALTGETGAGKTLLVAALGLLRGQRSDRSRVREGASETIVEGRFRVGPGHPAIDLLLEQGILDPGDEAVEVVLSRTIPADDRAARARINGRLVTASVLSAVGSALVEIAGQNQHQLLAEPATQRRMLDAFIGPEAIELAREVAGAVREAARTARELEALVSGERERQRRLDVLRFEVSEIEAAAPEEGESDRLKSQSVRLEHAASIAGALDEARRVLKSEGGGVDLANRSLAHVADALADDPSLQELHDRLEAAAIELDDIAATMSSFEIDTDPGALDRLRDRIGELARLTRKYGIDEAAVLAYLEAARVELGELELQTGSIDELQERAADTGRRAAELAARLTALRRKGAEELAEAVTVRLGDLALGGARFEVDLQPCDLFEGGAERVEFLVAANPGESPRPLGKVASGGELSRIALALHLLSGDETVTTLVFDEVDAGVGGEAAQAVGRSLAQLASDRGAQVLVVTHLPQVAAWADSQYLVDKRNVKGRSSVEITHVEGERRVEELSRMLAGLPESDRAREHAAELLEIAGRAR